MPFVPHHHESSSFKVAGYVRKRLMEEQSQMAYAMLIGTHALGVGGELIRDTFKLNGNPFIENLGEPSCGKSESFSQTAAFVGGRTDQRGCYLMLSNHTDSAYYTQMTTYKGLSCEIIIIHENILRFLPSFGEYFKAYSQ